MEEGWIKERESTRASSLGGRKPFHIYFNHNAKFIVGVDIGGTTVEIAVMNLDGKVKGKTSFDTQSHLSPTFVQALSNYMMTLITTSGLEVEQIIGAGVGVPGITAVDDGIVFDAPSLGWKQYPLKEKLEKLLPFPVYIDNDVNVAVLGEKWKGAGKTKDNVLLITLGTGVGCGMIINGRLYRGSSFAAGEIGYVITDKNAAEKAYKSVFSGYGFLDSHVGGPSITERMLNRLGDHELDEKNWTAEAIFQLAKNGDKLALEVVNDALSHLAFALINVIAIVNPECVVLGGGISKSIDYFLPNILATIDKHVPMNTEITITQLEDVSLLGAAFLLLSEHDSILKVE
ncbi:ROK family protein [Bacillus sp. FJAT-50079]|nr:ROK family protein [Bacillus sp. FJAT-50079]MBS4208005.1 ROK family protein [Bacillus sp. FJAT-50079]